MKFLIKKQFVVILVALCYQPVIAQDVLSDKVLEWKASAWGNGFGHKIYAKDPGGRTELNIAARHNTSVWTDMISLTSQGNVGIGIINPKAKLAVNGTILATEVKIKTNISVPDYVFDPEYELPELIDIESYIKEHRHLPEIPSAKDIERDGLDLAEMNLLLLKKVEELTLHIIDLNRTNELQNKEIAELKSAIKKQ